MNTINLDKDMTAEQIDVAIKKLELKRNALIRPIIKLNSKAKVLLKKIEKYITSLDIYAEPYAVESDLVTRIEEDFDMTLHNLEHDLEHLQNNISYLEKDHSICIKNIKLHKEKCKLLDQLKKELAKQK